MNGLTELEQELLDAGQALSGFLKRIAGEKKWPMDNQRFVDMWVMSVANGLWEAAERHALSLSGDHPVLGGLDPQTGDPRDTNVAPECPLCGKPSNGFPHPACEDRENALANQP